MTGRRFSLADAEAVFSQEDWEHMDREVAAAPAFRPELREQLRTVFVSARVMRQPPAADAA
ncbi:hypothetical protein [Streptomyces sp. ME01-18h]|uniref:hypothetical protein n=1 Tax=Streptomyces sp. ME01-18h TaxID=462920 RepID=UPI0029A2D0EC|nr:hypothetical protein [Streptomyces sp. ME01-18h]MDX3398388.1 hypothetical protein [Streptomyces sp. ME01-18h]